MSHRKRKSDDDVEWRKKKTKRKSKDVESVFFFLSFIHQQYQIMAMLSVWTM